MVVSGCLVTEMLRNLTHVEAVYARSPTGSRKVQRILQSPGAWRIRRLVFLKKPDARREKGLRGFCAIALLSVLSEWCTSVLVGLLHEEQEAIEWRNLHVGVERSVNCEHMQTLGTNLLQRHREWKEELSWQAWT